MTFSLINCSSIVLNSIHCMRIFLILRHLVCIANAKKVIYQKIIHNFESGEVSACLLTSFVTGNDFIHGVRRCNIDFTLEDVTNTC